jgi:hypothetical protein
LLSLLSATMPRLAATMLPAPAKGPWISTAMIAILLALIARILRLGPRAVFPLTSIPHT